MDSGIGGATVLKEILKVLPKEKFIYYSDSKNNPYGDKTPIEIYKIVNGIIKYLISKGCFAIVIACNTASAVCVKKLRKDYPNIIFIAIEPAYKMVHDYNFSGKTLVMATKGTIESEKFLSLYHKYDNHNTILLPCIGLAEIIENQDKKKLKKYLNEHLGNIKNIENVVLGCTHYPLIKQEIKEVLGNVKFFDGSVGVSLELKRQLQKQNLITNDTLSLEFIDTSKEKEKEVRFRKILNLN